MHYPVAVETIVMDTTDDMVILPGTMRVEAQDRCGCDDSLCYDYPHC